MDIKKFLLLIILWNFQCCQLSTAFRFYAYDHGCGLLAEILDADEPITVVNTLHLLKQQHKSNIKPIDIQHCFRHIGWGTVKKIHIIYSNFSYCDNTNTNDWIINHRPMPDLNFVTISYTNLCKVPLFQFASAIESLILRNNKITIIPLMFPKYYPKLKVLDLSYNPISQTSTGFNNLDHTPIPRANHLEILRLSYTNITSWENEILSSKLRSLMLNGSPLKTLHIPFKSTTSRIDVSYTELTNLNQRMFRDSIINEISLFNASYLTKLDTIDSDMFENIKVKHLSLTGSNTNYYKDLSFLKNLQEDATVYMSNPPPKSFIFTPEILQIFRLFKQNPIKIHQDSQCLVCNNVTSPCTNALIDQYFSQISIDIYLQDMSNCGK